MTSRLSTHRRLAGAALVALLTLSACGSDEASDDAIVTETDDASGAQGGDADAEPEPDVDPDPEAVDDADDDAADAGDDAVDAGGVQENRPVDVSGAPLAPYDSSIEDLMIGGPSPVISGASFDGTPITFGGETENPTLVVFLAHWCPHCNEEVPELLELQADGRIPDGLDVIGVSTSVRSDGINYPPSEWIVDKQWTWPVLADDEDLTAIAASGGTSFPFAMILDTDGTVLARRAGQASGDETVEFIDDALATREA